MSATSMQQGSPQYAACSANKQSMQYLWVIQTVPCAVKVVKKLHEGLFKGSPQLLEWE
jgi:hypothetical protein